MRPKSYRLRKWLWGAACAAWTVSASGEDASALKAQPNLRKVHWVGSTARAPLGNGAEVDLTLVPDLQHASEHLLAAAHPLSGAVVITDVASGRILAWAEAHPKPEDPHSMVLDARVPAASLFKIVTTTALFERGGVNPQERVCIVGGEHGITAKHLEVPEDPKARCGSFLHAIGFSRNAVFAQLATRYLTRQDLVDTATRLGFNAPLPFETPALMGESEVPFNDLEFARAAAGFRGTTLSPLGAAHLGLIIASGGRIVPMRISAEKSNVATTEPQAADPKSPASLQVMRPSTAWRLTRMMEVTVHSGTSLKAFSDATGKSYLGPIQVAGKTGTLQRTPDGPTTSWFVGFAPSRKPRIVVSVMLQNRPVWRMKANVIARDVLRAYFASRGVRGVTSPFEAAPEETAH